MSPMRIRVSKSVVSEVLDGETVVLDMQTGVYFALNGTATRAWQLIAQGADFDSVVSQLHREFDVEREALVADLKGLVGELHARHLIELEASAS
jgi:hypothetical protein